MQRKLQDRKPKTFYLNPKEDSVLTALESLNNKKIKIRNDGFQ
jgi:hypothetical protein